MMAHQYRIYRLVNKQILFCFLYLNVNDMVSFQGGIIVHKWKKDEIEKHLGNICEQYDILEKYLTENKFIACDHVRIQWQRSMKMKRKNSQKSATTGNATYASSLIHQWSASVSCGATVPVLSNKRGMTRINDKVVINLKK